MRKEKAGDLPLFFVLNLILLPLLMMGLICNKVIKRLLYLFFLLVAVVSVNMPLRVHAQEPRPKIERSTEKVILGGKIYYIHIVKKGETLYSISRAYGVSQKEISQENPVLVTGLQPGMALKIPFVEKTSTAEPVVTGGKYLYHTMREGETLYSLSRQYHVEVDEILRLNPDLKVDDIPLGARIRIPVKRVVPDRISFSRPQGKYRIHEVKPGETLYSIARNYHLTVRDLKKVNKGLRNKIRPGQQIRIPLAPAAMALPEVPETLPDTLAEDTTLLQPGGRTVFEPAFPCDTAVMMGAERIWHIALMLPFYLKENDERSYIDSSRVDPSTGKKIKKIIYRDPSWIYPPTITLLPFYQGVVTALDTLGKRGVRAEITVFDTEKDLSVVDSLIRSGALDSMDLIIGPVYPSTLSLVAEYSRKKHIPVISPLSRKSDFLHFNPYAFQCKPSRDLEHQYVAAFLAENTDKNLVIIHSDDSIHHDLYVRAREYIYDALLPDLHPDDVVIKEVSVPPVIAPTDTMNNIRLSLDKYKENVVWVLSDEEGFVSEVVSRLHAHGNEYPITLVGGSTWRYFRNMELEFFFRMNLHLFTTRIPDYEGEVEKYVIRSFRERYHTDPGVMSFAWDGYDETVYFLTLLQRYGTSFEECAGYFNPSLCIGRFDFRRTGWFSGFINTSMILLQYNNDFTITEIPFSREGILH